MRANLTRTVQQVLADLPCPQRRLAAEVGISRTLLTLIQQGHREATPAVAQLLAGGLRKWGAWCAQAAGRMERAARQVPTPRTKGD